VSTFTAYNATTHPIVRLEDDWNNLLDHGLDKAVKFIVRVNGSVYEALNGSTGKLVYGGSDNVGGITGTDASAVINAAVGALTAGRSNIEWIKLVGSFTLNKYGANDYCVKITTLTGLDLTGAILTLANAQDCKILWIESSTSPQTHSWVKGGIINGNASGQTSAGVGVYVYEGSHNILENVTVRNCYSHGFQITGAGVSWAGLHRIDGCRSYYNGGSGFVTNNQSDNYFYGCVSQNNTSYGFWFIYPQHATRCHAIYNLTGFNIASHCHLTDCYADTNNRYGFYVYSSTETIYQVFFNGCYSFRNSQTTDDTYDNFYIQDVDDVQLVNCRAKPKITAPADANNARYGFYLNNCDNASLTNCVAQKHASHGIYINNSNGVSLSNCQTMDNVKYGIRLESSNNCTATGCVSSTNGYTGLSANICSYLTVNGGNYYNNDSGDTATYHGISLNGDSNYCVINGVSAYGNDAYQIAVLAAACDNCTVTNNTLEATDCTGTLSNSGTNCIIRFNQGYVTENYGTGTINSGATTTTITHGLSITPASGTIRVTFREQATNDVGDTWITNITDTQFTVNVRNDPGASNLDIGWSVW